MKYTIYKNEVGQLMAMEGHCEFDGVVAQAIDYDAIREKLFTLQEALEFIDSQYNGHAGDIAREAFAKIRGEG